MGGRGWRAQPETPGLPSLRSVQPRPPLSIKAPLTEHSNQTAFAVPRGNGEAIQPRATRGFRCWKLANCSSNPSQNRGIRDPPGLCRCCFMETRHVSPIEQPFPDPSGRWATFVLLKRHAASDKRPLRHGNCLDSRNRRLSADLNHRTVVFPIAGAALTVLNLIQYTWQALTYDKSAVLRSESIVLPKRQSVFFGPDQGSLT